MLTKQVQSNSLIYKLFEDYFNYLEILENLAKCRYNVVSNHLEKILKGAEADPILVGHKASLNFEIKKNIIKEVIGNVLTCRLSAAHQSCRLSICLAS